MPNLKIRLPEEALHEFDDVEKMDWGEGIALTTLISWINAIEELYRPEEVDARSGKPFTERSFRHYQTLGAIDPPNRIGKLAMYGFRQYLQALVIRKLLWEKFPSDQVVGIMAGKSNEQYKNLLFQGIEIVPGNATSAPASKNPQTWVRHPVSDSVELHIKSGSPSLSRKEIQEILSEIERVLSK